jgi:ATP-dependent DNA ligase
MHDLPVPTTLQPMLGRLSRELPRGEFLYEPKWDGFRCLAFRSGGEVDLRSRHGRPLARYFPELVDGLRALPEERLVLDAEIVTEAGFPALMTRLHPAPSRVERLRQEVPAWLVCFDLIAVGSEDLRQRPFGERRALLEQLLEGVRAPLLLTPATDDPELAGTWLERFEGGGIDGVLAKPLDMSYEAGVRAMLKVKHERTADCVLAGVRLFPDRPVLSSLLLGLHDADGRLEHVGVVTSFRAARREELLDELAPLVAPLEGHPWEHGFLTGGSPMGRLPGAASRWSPAEMIQDWVPLAPERVCEVAYDHVDFDRFRHPARFKRWRPDRDPASCTFDQLEPPSAPVRELLRPA